MLPLWFAFLGGSFVFLDVGPMILFFVFPLFWVLWFIYYWQGVISLSNTRGKSNKMHNLQSTQEPGVLYIIIFTMTLKDSP
jgi:hypothetical protein